MLCHQPEGWVQTDQKCIQNVRAWFRIIWVRNVHGYEMTRVDNVKLTIGVEKNWKLECSIADIDKKLNFGGH